MTFRRRPTVDTPLGDLVAGKITQAEYRRRRLEQLQREQMELHVPEPVITTRRIHVDGHIHDDSCRHWVVWAVLAIAWILAAIAVALLIAHLARSAAPRSSPDPTTDAASRVGTTAGRSDTDPSLSAGTSGPTTSGAPLDVRHTTGPNLAPTVSAGTDDVRGAPSALTWKGKASWYDDGPGLYAAVHSFRWGDPRYTVRVCRQDAKNTCVLVTVRDHMASTTKAIDLGPDAFVKLWPGIDRETALWTYGTVDVVVETGMPAPRVTPPTTDVAP